MSDLKLLNPGTGISAVPQGTLDQPGNFNLVPQDDSYKRQDSVANHLLYGPPGVVAGFFQTVGSSLRLLDPDAVEQTFENTQFGDYYSRNKSALTTIGDLGGMFIPGMAAQKLVQGGGWLSRAATFGLRGMETSEGAYFRYNAARNAGSKVLGNTTFADDPWLAKIFTSGQQTGQKLSMLENKYGQVAKATGQVDWSIGNNFRDWNKDVTTLLKTNTWDALKENIAFEFGVFATMNQSETLYPDEWTMAEYAALNVPLPALGVLASRIYTKGQIAKLSGRLGEQGYATRFPDVARIGEFSGRSRAGDRGLTISQAWNSRNVAVDLSQNQLGDYRQQVLLNTNMNAQVVAFENIVKQDAERAGQDSVLPEITNKFEFGQENFNVLKSHLEQNQFKVNGAISFEAMPTGSGYAGDQILARQKSTVKSLYEKHKLLQEDADKMSVLGYPGWESAVDKAKIAKQNLQNAEDAVVITFDPSGVAVPASERPLLAQDFLSVERNISHESGDMLSAGVVKLKSSERVTGDSSMQTFLSYDIGTGRIMLPQTTNITMIQEGIGTFFNGKNVTKLITGKADEVEARTNELKILKDISQDWGVRGHRFRKEIAPKLSAEATDSLQKWLGSSNAGNIRKWVDDANSGDPKALRMLEEIHKANEPARQRLRELANLRGGTIRLFRGVGAKEARGESIPDVASYSANLDTALHGFGSHTLSKEVDPDDILAVVAGIRDTEFEYIVRNNKLRVAPGLETTPSGQKVTRTTQQLTNADAEFDTLNTAQMSEAYYLVEQGVNRIAKLAKEGKLDQPIFRDPSQNIMQADEVIRLHEVLSPEQFNNYVKLPDNMDMDKVHMHAANHSYRRFLLWQDVQAGIQKEGTSEATYNSFKMSDTEFRYGANLPQPGVGNLDPWMTLFQQVRLQGDKSLMDAFASWQDLKMALFTGNEMPAVTNPLLKTLENNRSRGYMLKWDNEKNKAFNVVYSGKSDTRINTRQGLQEAATQQRVDVLERFRQSEEIGAIFPGITYRNVYGTQDGLNALNISTLGNGSQRGDGIFTTRNFAAGDAPALRAMDSIVDKTTREANSAIGTLFRNSGAQDVPARLALNSKAQDETNRFIHIRRQGWRVILSEDPTTGKRKWVLDPKNSLNEKNFQKYYGESLLTREGETLMPDTTVPVKPGEKMLYRPFETTESLTDEAVQMMEVLADQAHKERVALARINGQADPAHIASWVPAINFASPHTALVRDKITGETITMLEADSASILTQKIAASIEAYKGVGQEIEIIDAKALENAYQLRDEALTKLVDFSDPLAQTGAAKGTQAGLVYTTGRKPMQDLLNSYQHLFQSFGRRARVTYFEPTINQVRALDASMAVGASSKGQNATPPRKFLNSVYDNPTLDPNSALGHLSKAVEGGFDKVLEAVQNRISKKFGGRADDFGEDKLADRLAGDDHFGETMDFVQRSVNVPDQWRFKNVASAMNALTGNLTLRMFETGSAVLNMISLAVTTPAVIKALKILPGETEADWVKRSALIATRSAANPNHPIFSGPRAMITAVHEMYNDIDPRTGKLISQIADERGFTTPTMFEMAETLVKPHEGPVASRIRSFTDMVSKPFDYSEKMSRKLSFFTGYAIAKHGYGMENLEDRFAFALRFANDNVGDYRPHNRPQMFQGAAGMPLGLFTTFMWNYYQRLFKYVENKQTGAFMTQMFTQASIFGVKTVPGFSQYVNFFASNYDGSENPVDAFRNKFGDEAADWFFYGTVSNLPKMFGASDGIAMHTRGDAGFRMIPTVFTPGDMPAVQMIKKLYGAATDTMAALKNNGLSPKQIAEISAQYSISRPWRSLVETVTGNSLDSSGRIVNDNVHQPMSIAARVLSMRTLTEAKNMEAWASIGDAQATRQARMEELRNTVRYNLREGSYEGTKGGELLAGHIRDYITRGGDPIGIPEWLRDQALASSVDRSTLQIFKLLKGNINQNDLKDTKKLIWSQMPLTEQDYE